MTSARRSARSVARLLGAAAALTLLGPWPTLVRAATTGTTSLFSPNGAQTNTTQGEYVSTTGGMDTFFRYFVEVPPGPSRLRVQLFDADIGAGATGDRARGGFDTRALYRIFGPDGVQRPSLLAPGTPTGPAGANGAWLDLYNILSGGNGDRVRDQFGAVAYNNNNGNINWTSNWTETNDDGNPGAGTEQIIGGQLRFRPGGTACMIERQANLTGWANAVFSFDFNTSANVDANDQMRVQVSNNGGTTWTTLETFTGPFTTAESRAYNIAAFIAANTRVRFLRFANYTNTESFFVDNVQIQNPTLPAGHWEVQVDMSSAVNPTGTTGDDINDFGLRADDGDATSGGTELNVYHDSHTTYGNNGAPEADPRSYVEFPYVTSGCSCSSNDFDTDDIGSLTYTSRSGAFTRTFADAQLSTTDAWKGNPMAGWTTDSTSVDYGIWRLNVLETQPFGGANYSNVWVGNFLAPDPAVTPPAVNPTPNAFRVYLPGDGGAAPVKPYLEQFLTYVSGANPPAVGQTTTLMVTVRIANPTLWPITFSATNQVTVNVPGPSTDVTYQGGAQVSMGTITGQPGVGGIGNITWNPGTGNVLAAGATAILFYPVAITPTVGGQRIPVTGVVSTGTGADGTRATFLDETGNATQARATYALGPICELAATVNLLTPAVVSSVRAHDSARGVVVEWETASEVGTVGFDLLRWDPETSQYVTVNKKLLLGLVASPQGGRYRFVDEGASAFEAHHYVLAEVGASGERRFHGPFQVKVDRVSSTRSVAAADGYERVSRSTPLALGRALQAHRAEAAMTAAVTARRAGSAMKIGVDASGVYRVSAQAIATTLDLPLARVQSLIATRQLALSNQGHAVAWMRALGDGILFYGQALDSIYTRDNVYWLRPGNGLTMPPANGGSPSLAGPGQSFVDVTHAEQDRLPATVVSHDPESDYWFWDYLSGGDAVLGRKSFPVVASGIAAGGATARLRVKLQGATSTGVAGEHHVVIRLNGVAVGEAQWQGMTPETVDLTMSAGLVHEGDNAVELEALLDPGVPYSIVYADSFDLSYPRRYQAVGGALAFSAGANAVVTVDGFTDGRIEIWDLSSPLRPRRVNRVTIGVLPLGRFVASFIPRSPDAPYVAATPQGWRTPKWVTADSPSRLKTNQGADYVILTTAEMTAPARRLAALREAQGLRSRVVDLVDVMDEFNFGVSSPHAVRAFLDCARRRWSPAPRFVLLAGAGTLDYKDNMGFGGNLVPPLMAATPSGLFASDNLFVDFDGDRVPEMAIGRVAALTAAELDSYGSKIQAYEASDGAGWKERALWVADDPDGAVDFGADASRLASSLPEGYAPEAIYLAPGTIAATRAQLLSGLASGAGLMNYVGHGALDRLASEGLLVTADANSLGNGERLPVLTALTCIINRFEVPGLVPLGAALVRSPTGGAAAVWAPTGLSSNGEANVLGARFYEQMASGPGERLGEIVQRALGAHARANPESSLVNVYNLLGDPALALKQPEAAPPGGVPDAFSGLRPRD